jgi:ribonuclease HIII
MASNSVSLLVNDIAIEKMMSFYDAVPTAEDEIILFSAKSADTRITCYRKTHNGLRKVLFQGSNAEYEASIWGYVPEPEQKKEAGRVLEDPVVPEPPKPLTEEIALLCLGRRNNA